ncbi:MAG: hypothetical protein WBN65_12500 [Gammaproteobacteria bacterium]
MLVLVLALLSEVQLSFALPGGSVAFAMGRLIVAAIIYAIPAFILWKVWKGRNWARIALAIVVVLHIALVMMLMQSPLGIVLMPAPFLTLALLAIEVVAIVLLFSANEWFSRNVV